MTILNVMSVPRSLTKASSMDKRLPLFYHGQCLRCTGCHRSLAIGNEERCFVDARNLPQCLTCKKKLTACRRCNVRVPGDAWVFKLRGQAFHLSCFTCSRCGHQLSTGERCFVQGDQLLCAEHLPRSPNIHATSTPTSKEPSNTSPCHLMSKHTTSLQRHDMCGGKTVKDNCASDKAGHHDSLLLSKRLKYEPSSDFLDHHHFTPPSPPEDHLNIISARPITTTASQLDSHDPEDSEAALPSPNEPPPQPQQPQIINIRMDDEEELEEDVATIDEEPLMLLESDYASSSGGEASSSGHRNTSASGLMLLTMPSCSSATGSIASSSTTGGGHLTGGVCSSGGHVTTSCGGKSKRIRTSFTPDQLAILQANFDVEANPDGQELERIANSAHLNKRVTQVWFQNARARKKKTERNSDPLMNGCMGMDQQGSLGGCPSTTYDQDKSTLLLYNNSTDCGYGNQEDSWPLGDKTQRSQFCDGDKNDYHKSLHEKFLDGGELTS